MESFLIAARAVHYASTISLAGVFAFLCFVVGPVISPRAPRSAVAGRLGEPRVGVAVWRRVAAVCLGTDERPADRRHADARGRATVLTRTRFGQVWILRFALAVILAGLLLLPQGWRGRWWRWGGLAFAAGTLASLAWAGHGAATPGRPGDLHLAADILHLLAAGAWVGSLIPLALLLAEIAPKRRSRFGARRRGGRWCGFRFWPRSASCFCLPADWSTRGFLPAQYRP